MCIHVYLYNSIYTCHTIVAYFMMFSWFAHVYIWLLHKATCTQRPADFCRLPYPRSAPGVWREETDPWDVQVRQRTQKICEGPDLRPNLSGHVRILNVHVYIVIIYTYIYILLGNETSQYYACVIYSYIAIYIISTIYIYIQLHNIQ